jgi:deoxyribodipyrimidine photo-lyase
MLAGLAETEKELRRHRVGFSLLAGEPGERLPRYLGQLKASVLVADFDPLKIKRAWKKEVVGRIGIPFYEVDAHNIVPCWVASGKQEFGAYTLRPKIHKALPDFLTDFPVLRRHLSGSIPSAAVDWQKVRRAMKADRVADSCDGIAPGPQAAQKAMRIFLKTHLKDYAQRRNDPSLAGQSGLSPYIHFGQLSAQRLALEASRIPSPSCEAFLEELIVRRELSDNYCLYNPLYDRFKGLPAWARQTLEAHASDKRPYIYSRKQLEEAQTHDPYWNAAQRESVVRGKMHGYMRMYWGKKILEWTADPEEAFETAVCLNDRYELDGRDPNGYAGIAWCFGSHDRAWGERSVFGKVRYMNAGGLERKFEMEGYVRSVGIA